VVATSTRGTLTLLSRLSKSVYRRTPESLLLIRRVRDPTDRRRHLVEVTETGHEVFQRAQRARESVEDEVLAALSAEERATLRGLLAKALGD
jgi:DNA-binding MarR family transcriptional regulator